MAAKVFFLCGDAVVPYQSLLEWFVGQTSIFDVIRNHCLSENYLQHINTLFRIIQKTMASSGSNIFPVRFEGLRWGGRQLN